MTPEENAIRLAEVEARSKSSTPWKRAKRP